MEPKQLKADSLNEALNNLIKEMERKSRSKVFAWRTKDIGGNKLGILAVFEDKSIIEGVLTVDIEEDMPTIRIQGNYI